MKLSTFLSTTMAVAALFTIPTAEAASDLLFTMTNAEDVNEVLMYKRDPDLGAIGFIGAFDTGKFTIFATQH